jgi:ATP-dependent Lon protease
MNQLDEIVNLFNNIFNYNLSKIHLNYNDKVKFKNEYIENINNVLPEKDLVEKTQNKVKLKYNINNLSSDDFTNLVETWESSGYNININNFLKIKNRLLKLSKKVGFYSLDDALNLIIGPKYSDIFIEDTQIIYKLLNSVYIPLCYSSNLNNIIISSPKITYKIIKSEVEILLENFIEIKIVYDKYIYIFKGFLKNDSLNILIKTSQISNPIIYEKNKSIQNYFSNIKNIPDFFKNNYIKNLNLYEVLCLTKENILDMMQIDYNKYIELSKVNFRNIVDEEFINDNTTIFNQFKIIKILLTGNTDENHTLAGILFGLTKEKKIGSDYINNIIYKNLPFAYQIKLKKLNLNIKNELDKLKSISFEEIDINKQLLLNKNIPSYVKKLIIEKSNEMKNSTSDYHKQKTYIEILMNYPWINNNDTNDIFKRINGNLLESRKFINNFCQTIDKKVFGHNDCKNTIKQLIGKWVSNPHSVGKSIGLYGPPGTGKTLIAKSLGEALNIPFVQINIGGKDDRCELSGHSYTYNSAQPGLIVRKMVEAGSPRCIMYFDELDKAGYKHGINEIFNVLIHVTDRNTNDKYSDSFFSEVAFPLSQVLFVFSYNDPLKVDRILLDRMEKIEVKPFTLSEKIYIVQNFLLKELTTEIGIPNDSIIINEPEIEHIIETYTYEAGIRDLRNKLESLLLKLNLDRINGTGIFNLENSKFTITKEIIDDHLNKKIHDIKKVNTYDEVGMINGLFATSIGTGGIIPIIIYNNYTGNKFTLKITGSQGAIMKESVEFSFTTAVNIIKPEYYKLFLESCKLGLHIHTPDGASPKDGPSAGAAFTIAFISKILNIKIKKDVAITGEIDTFGKISAIGGLIYKIKGAIRAGVTTIIIPDENKTELREILEKEPHLNNIVNIIKVNHIKEALQYALINENLDNFII